MEKQTFVSLDGKSIICREIVGTSKFHPQPPSPEFYKLYPNAARVPFEVPITKDTYYPLAYQIKAVRKNDGSSYLIHDGKKYTNKDIADSLCKSCNEYWGKDITFEVVLSTI